MAGDRASRALGPADLEDHHRLASISRAVERRDEPLGLAHGLEEQSDDPRGGIVDEVLEVVHGV